MPSADNPKVWRGREARDKGTPVTTTIAWSRRAADELWSGVVTPLTFSLLAETMATHMAHRRLEQAGLTQASAQPVFRLFRGHVYVNASLVRDVMAEVPSALLSDGVLALLPEPYRADLRARPRALYDPRTLATIARLTWNEESWTPWSRAHLFRVEAERVASELEGFASRPGATPEEIATAMEAVRARLGAFLEVVSWAMIYAYVFFHLLSHLCEEWLPEGISLSALVAGVPGIRTFEVHRELEALARTARESPELMALLGRSSEVVVRAVERGELGEFGREIAELRRRHGHRLAARDLSYPTWSERPELLVDMVRRLAAAAPATARTDVESVRADVRERLETGPLGGIRWRLFELGLHWCQEYYAVRENMRYHADYFLAAFRSLALAGARALRERGVLAREGDVFYLTRDELLDALRDEPLPDLSERAAGRRREYEGFGAAVPPEVIWGDEDGGGDAAPGPEARSGRFEATPASPGTVEGLARIVRSVDELESVESGDVIVATATDPTWTSYLSLAAGLVLEVGGLLSHGAIIARELGIPAVVDLAGGTRVLRTGDRIRVDGGRGVVERLAPVGAPEAPS